MFKIIKSILVIVFIASSGVINTSAEEINNYTLINDITLYDENNDTYFIFQNTEDMYLFLGNRSNGISLYACLPGDPGYPNCIDNPIINVASKVISTSTTGLLENGQNLLPYWTYGGDYGASMSLSKNVTVGFSYKGLSMSVSLDHSQSFNVPPNKRGNIRYRAKFEITTYQDIYIYKDGATKEGNTYQTYRNVYGEFYPVYM